MVMGLASSTVEALDGLLPLLRLRLAAVRLLGPLSPCRPEGPVREHRVVHVPHPACQEWLAFRERGIHREP